MRRSTPCARPCSRSSPTMTARRSRRRSGSSPGRSSRRTRRWRPSAWCCRTSTTGSSTSRRSAWPTIARSMSRRPSRTGSSRRPCVAGRADMDGLPAGVELRGPDVPGAERILTAQAVSFVADLQRRFGPARLDLMHRRQERQRELDEGVRPDFPVATREVREAAWSVAPAPADLDDRRVEITGPAETKMMINALNSGARVFMADLEDALSPTWANVVGGQAALADAVRRELTFDSPEGKAYRLND